MLYARFLKLSDRYELISKNLLIIPYNNNNNQDTRNNDNQDTHNNEIFTPSIDDME
jgi:hypothetical protein